MILLLFISLTVFIVFNIWARKLFGVQKSISDYVYKLNKIKLFWKFTSMLYFRLFIIGISVPIIIYANNISIALTWSGTFILMVAFTANTKKMLIRMYNHVIGATGGIILGAAAFAIELTDWHNLAISLYFYALCLGAILSVIIMPIWKKPGVKNHTYWIEITWYLIIIIPLIINKLWKL